MRRTQLYLDNDLWNALHAQARRQRTTISNLVRLAARERYLGAPEDRKAAMEALIGIWKDRPDSGGATESARRLRRGRRIGGLGRR